jgi:FkbM family methyltransferase
MLAFGFRHDAREKYMDENRCIHDAESRRLLFSTIMMGGFIEGECDRIALAFCFNDIDIRNVYVSSDSKYTFEFHSPPGKRSMVRRVLQRLSRGIILKRKLPDEFGRASMYVSPEAMLGYWRWDLGKVDPYLLSMVRTLVRPGMTVWDIGANVGLFSFAAAATASRVVAVEADTWLANLIHRSSLLNQLPVTVLPAALNSTGGIAELHLSTEGRASNSLRGNGPTQTAVAVTLDWMLERFEAPQVIKIDVEGFELETLRGGTQLLRCKPIILCEVTQNHEAVGDLLRSAGYTLFAARVPERKPITRPSIETLAVPEGIELPPLR